MAWWLVDSILNGTLDEDYPIMNNDDVTIVGGGSSDSITFTSDGVGAADTINIGYPFYGPASPDTIDFGGSRLYPGGMGEDHFSFNSGLAHTAYDLSLIHI